MARAARSSEAIASVAATMFAERGYAATTVRDIAAAADVDPAIVIRRFGSKEALFLTSIGPSALAETWQRTVEGPVESFGERCVAALLDSGDDTRGLFLALLRASDTEGIGSTLRLAHEQQFVAPLRARIGGVDADLRARLAAAAAGGMLYALWAVGDAQLQASRDELVRRYGSVIQAAIA